MTTACPPRQILCAAPSSIYRNQAGQRQLEAHASDAERRWRTGAQPGAAGQSPQEQAKAGSAQEGMVSLAGDMPSGVASSGGKFICAAADR